MKNQFVSYEIALALKELGFDEECFGWFYLNKPSYIEYERCKLKDCSNVHIPSPLYQQVEQWFREKHQIIIAVHAYRDLDAIDEVDQILWEFTLWDKEWNDTSDYTYYHSYEEAREAAILEAIKIVKGEKK